MQLELQLADLRQLKARLQAACGLCQSKPGDCFAT